LQLVAQIRDTEGKIEAFDKQILSLARENEVCRRLMSVLTIGPFAATTLVATVGNPRYFASGHYFAARIGLVPKQYSTGGKERLGGIISEATGSQPLGAECVDRRAAGPLPLQYRHRCSGE
jgi:transposase